MHETIERRRLCIIRRYTWNRRSHIVLRNACDSIFIVSSGGSRNRFPWIRHWYLSLCAGWVFRLRGNYLRHVISTWKGHKKSICAGCLLKKCPQGSATHPTAHTHKFPLLYERLRSLRNESRAASFFKWWPRYRSSKTGHLTCRPYGLVGNIHTPWSSNATN